MGSAQGRLPLQPPGLDLLKHMLSPQSTHNHLPLKLCLREAHHGEVARLRQVQGANLHLRDPLAGAVGQGGDGQVQGALLVPLPEHLLLQALHPLPVDCPVGCQVAQVCALEPNLAPPNTRSVPSPWVLVDVRLSQGHRWHCGRTLSCIENAYCRLAD